MILRLLILFLLSTVVTARQCERLKATLTYTQEEAPRDLSSVVSGPMLDITLVDLFIYSVSHSILLHYNFAK